jgi:GAF domain-containing protein
MAADHPTMPATRSDEPEDLTGTYRTARAGAALGAARSVTARVSAAGGDGRALPAVVADFDFSGTGLGSPQHWSTSWLTAIQLCMDALDPTSVLLGPDLVQIFNEPYAQLVNGKDATFGRPVAENWAEVWDTIGAPIRAVYDGGRPLSLADQRLCIERDGQLVEAFFTYSCVPLREPDGTVTGVFNSARETTGRALARRRLGVLRALAALGRDTRSPEDFFARACDLLGEADGDLPFGLIYLFDKAARGYRLQAGFGLPEGDETIAPALLRPSRAGDAGRSSARRGGDGQQRGHCDRDWLSESWPGTDGGSRSSIVDGMAAHGVAVASRPWPEPVTRAYLGTIRDVPAGSGDEAAGSPGDQAADDPDRPAGGLVVFGIGTRLVLDEPYRQFLDAVAAEIEVGLARATADQRERARTSNLQTALESSRHIGAAIGVLMATLKVTEEQAFDLLRHTSQTTHRKLRDVAERVVETGTLSEGPGWGD